MRYLKLEKKDVLRYLRSSLATEIPVGKHEHILLQGRELLRFWKEHVACGYERKREGQFGGNYEVSDCKPSADLEQAIHGLGRLANEMGLIAMYLAEDKDRLRMLDVNDVGLSPREEPFYVREYCAKLYEGLEGVVSPALRKGPALEALLSKREATTWIISHDALLGLRAHIVMLFMNTMLPILARRLISLGWPDYPPGSWDYNAEENPE